MDPDENLKEQLRLAQDISFQIENSTTPNPDDVLQLTELIVALDVWISKGGFLPERWSKK